MLEPPERSPKQSAVFVCNDKFVNTLRRSKCELNLQVFTFCYCIQRVTRAG